MIVERYNNKMRKIKHALVYEYSNKSSIHGVKFVLDLERPLFERVTWALMIILAGIWMFSQLYAWWNVLHNSPTQVVIGNFRLDLSELEFPAVAICSVNKINNVKADRFIRRILGKNASRSSIDSYWNSITALSMMGYPHYHYAYDFVKENNLTLYPIKSSEISYIMQEVTHDIDDLFEACRWRGVKFNCSDLLRFQRTEEGFCYSFNSKTADRSYNETDYLTPPYSDKNGILRALKNSVSGRLTGLVLKFKSPGNNFKYNYQNRAKGYNVSKGNDTTIILHNPNFLPDVTKLYEIRKVGYTTAHLEVIVTRIKSEEAVKYMPTHLRRCYWFDHTEISEKGQPQVGEDENLCRVDCRLRVIKEVCNCTPYFFTSEIDDETHVYCGLEHMKCLSYLNLRLKFVVNRYSGKFNKHRDILLEENKYYLYPNISCQCTKPCTYVSYEAKYIKSHSNSPSIKSFWAYLDVSYEGQWAIDYTKFKTLKFMDFAVQIGGFASLLLGCSLISVLEIFYFFLRYFVYKFSSLIHNKVTDTTLNKTSTTSVKVLSEYPFLP